VLKTRYAVPDPMIGQERRTLAEWGSRLVLAGVDMGEHVLYLWLAPLLFLALTELWPAVLIT
jgi:hypothetical protein